jgi:GT2 family glycosyltransferase
MTYTEQVSVIIPSIRVDLVDVLLTTLQHQTYPSALTEIILVGQGLSSIAKRWPMIRSLETTHYFLPGEGRNIGARAATGSYLLFIDDDCEPAPDWIEQNIRALQDKDVGAVGGQVAGKSKAFFAQCVDFSSFAFCQTSTRRETQICSASMGMRRDVFEQVQGFDETLRTCEDIDLCYRLTNLGYKTLYQPAIKVRHNHRRTTFTTLISYSYFYGRVSGLNVKSRYPGKTRRNQIIAKLRHPILYALMILPISLGITMIIVHTNVEEYPRVLLYAPFIFLSKMAFHIGTVRWLIDGPLTNIA